MAFTRAAGFLTVPADGEACTGTVKRLEYCPIRGDMSGRLNVEGAEPPQLQLKTRVVDTE
jgi:hypothetical protein